MNNSMKHTVEVEHQVCEVEGTATVQIDTNNDYPVAHFKCFKINGLQVDILDREQFLIEQRALDKYLAQILE